MGFSNKNTDQIMNTLLFEAGGDMGIVETAIANLLEDSGRAEPALNLDDVITEIKHLNQNDLRVVGQR